ncbi:hypothetical protein BJY01DRAFT_204419 [Aspergillus pseudoustus]|uniref:Uncharacterized protein n=1 Tax=Aspergillus pseudoustus TaxID=1810923 RepID=A0ABR4KSN5_9EURO
MRIPRLLHIALLLSARSATANETNNVWELALTLPHDLSGEGFVHLGDDGVLRSYNGAGLVLGYHALDPDQIAQYNSGFPISAQEHLREVFKGVNGRAVTDPAQLTNPVAELRPPKAETSLQCDVPTVVDRLAKRA